MVIAYYHGYVTLERLREYTHTTKEGTSAYHLIMAAKEFGFHAYGIEMKEFPDPHLIFPLIAHVKTEEGYFHYVVIYAYHNTRQTLCIADPAKGISTISLKEFQKFFTGVVIILYPVTTLPILDRQFTLSTFLLPLIKPYFRMGVKICLLSFLYGVFTMGSSYYFTLAISQVNRDQSEVFFLLITLLMAIVYIVKNVTEYMRDRLFVLFHEKISVYLEMDVYKRLLFLPYQYYANRTAGEILSKMNIFSELQTYLEAVLVFFSFDFVLAICVSLLFFSFDIGLFFLYLFFALVEIGMWRLLRERYHRKECHMQTKEAVLKQSINESLVGFESIKGLHVEKNILSHILHRRLLYSLQAMEYQTFRLRHFLFRLLLQDGIYIISVFLLGMMVLEGRVSIAKFILFQSFVPYFLGAMQKSLELELLHSRALVALEQLSFLFQENKEEIHLSRRIKGSIQLRNFTYERNEKLLFDHVTLDIRKGEKILLLGPSGSGKSTLLKVLMRYYKSQKGEVFLDNIDILDYQNSDIDLDMIYLDQIGTLFTGTLYYNIVLSRKVERQKLEEVLKLCAIDQILKKRNCNLSLYLEENGTNLSGGERQRILLARALLSPFQILLLDESTSQIDQGLEEKILSRIFLKYYDKTIIVISHRRENIHLFSHVFEIVNKKLEVVR